MTAPGSDAMTDLSELISDLEGATGPEPELARKLAAALFGTGFTIPQVLLCRAALSDGIEAIGAAIVLVGEKLDCDRIVGVSEARTGEIEAHSAAITVRTMTEWVSFTASAPTPALAVLIALLKALETQ